MIKFIKSHVQKDLVIEAEDLNDITKAINRGMNEVLLKYSPQFDGILIWFKFIKTTENFQIKDDGKMICSCFLKLIHLVIEKNSVLEIRDGYFLETFKVDPKISEKENFKLKFDKIEDSPTGEVLIKGSLFS